MQPPPIFPRFRFQTGFSGFAVEFSPFESAVTRLAVATAQHFGLVGNGRLHILRMPLPEELIKNPNHQDCIIEENFFDTAEGLTDCAWSEQNENIIAVSSIDGSIKLFDTAMKRNRPDEILPPLRTYMEHKADALSVDWNVNSKNTFLSSSFDHSIKLWDPNTQNNSITTFLEHTGAVYQAIFSPQNPTRFASCSEDHFLKIWDFRKPDSVISISGHNSEILTCDWNKYNEFVIVTGSVDKTIKMWDLRKTANEVGMLKGHTFSVKKVKYSPHSTSTLLSSSYDMSINVWDTLDENPLIHKLEHHTEFSTGISFNLFVEGQIATTGWDNQVVVFPKLPLKRF